MALWHRRDIIVSLQQYQLSHSIKCVSDLFKLRKYLLIALQQLLKWLFCYFNCARRYDKLTNKHGLLRVLMSKHE